MMNPSVGGWNNPPPPGTEAIQEDEDEHSSTSSKTKSTPGEDLAHKFRSIDRIDPYLKNPDYVEYEKHSRDRSRHHRRSRSRSKYSEKDRKSRDSDRRHKSRSRSRDRHRRSRSRGRRHHRHRSYSRSPSTNRSRHGKSKKEKRHRRSSSRPRRYSRSYSRSRSRSKSRRGHYRSKPHHSRGHDDLRSASEDKDDQLNTSGEVEDEEEPVAKENAFKNDGSFLEMFKKMQEEQQKATEAAAKEQASAGEMKKPLPAFGKRRGGRVLKTGLVEKTKATEDTTQSEALDAWSVYMKEVKRYKEACCDDDSKTRPLVK